MPRHRGEGNPKDRIVIEVSRATREALLNRKVRDDSYDTVIARLIAASKERGA